jgi:mRNA interferase RelE/StbE
MESYKIEFTKSAEKDLGRIDKQFIAKILEKIDDLALNPLEISKKLQARSGYRLRVGDYRVIYDLEEDSKLISIFKISHRQDAYKK